jgi:hypothetical protein
MGWFGKLMFGSLGMVLAGPLGAIAGAALGQALVDKKADFARQANRAIPQPRNSRGELRRGRPHTDKHKLFRKRSRSSGSYPLNPAFRHRQNCVPSRLQTKKPPLPYIFPFLIDNLK